MSLKVNQLLFLSEDGNAAESTNFWTTQDQTAYDPSPYSALIAAWKAVSDCKLSAVQFQRSVDGTGGVGTGAYKTVWDRAVFPLLTATGRRGQLAIVGPKEDIFQAADNSKVDMGAATVVDLIAEVLGSLGDSEGNPWVTVGQGVRQKINV